MEIKGDKVMLRDFMESDIETMIHWETVETEWQLWDGPWEYEEEVEAFDPEKYRQERLAWLAKQKDENRVRWRFQICINNEEQTHIGWCSAYFIDDQYQYTKEQGKCAIGIDIPAMCARNKGYATAALVMFIQYLRANGIEEIYTQTWSGNVRMIGLAKKLGFEECNRILGIRKVRGDIYDALTFKLDMHKFQKTFTSV